MHQHLQMLASSYSSSPSTAPPLVDPPSKLLHDSTVTATIAAASTATKRKRRPAGTPDPEAEVVSLSPRTLLESERYVCEICKKGFQRDQNLQMHRRRHKVPWKLAKRASSEAGGSGRRQRRVYVCPEPNCLHHEAGHALGDLVGIKKHFRRKHGGRRQWGCGRCGRTYAVQSDYKAHLKTCGTRGHSCHCGRVFSRVESFIEHQDACTVGSGADTPRSSAAAAAAAVPLKPTPLLVDIDTNSRTAHAVVVATAEAALGRTVELQLLPAATATTTSPSSEHSSDAELLRLSIGPTADAAILNVGEELTRLAVAEKVAADEDREQAAKEAAAAEREYAEAKAVRQRARAELEKAAMARDRAAQHVAAVLGQLTCHACRASHVRTGDSSVDVP